MRRRALLVAAIVAVAVAAIAVAAAVSRSGGGGSDVVATVGGVRVTREQLDLTVDHFHEEAEREGTPFPAHGTPAFRKVQRRSLDLLVYRARLTAAAARIGVHVSDDEVARRLGPAAGPVGGGDDEGTSVRTDAEAAFVRGTVRAQLLTQKVFERVTTEIDVPPAAVRAYYDAHRAIYGRAPFRGLAPSIRRQLVSARRNAAMDRWLAKARRIPAEIRDDALRS